MDISFSNVLEGTRQYFMGLPKQAQAETTGQHMWPSTVLPSEEGAPAQSGAPAPTSRPPSAAAAPPTTPGALASVATVAPPRPPSEPLEPEPHIIHKPTVMREAAKKRRELPEPEDDEEHNGSLSPPSHIIRKPTPHTLPSPAPAPAAPCPSPARPPSELPPPPSTSHEPQQEPPIHLVQTSTVRPPDHFASGRPDPYTASRPPEQYLRYHYDNYVHDANGRSSLRQPVASPQPSLPPRHIPQTYSRMTGSMPQQTTSRLRETTMHSPPAQRHTMPLSQHLPPHNDRVPPIHHPSMVQSPQRTHESRSAHVHASQHLSQRRETMPTYSRSALHGDRYVPEPMRKHDPQHTYPGYRPSPTSSQQLQGCRSEQHYQPKYVTAEALSHNTVKTVGRPSVLPQHNPQEAMYVPPSHADYRNLDVRSNYTSYPSSTPPNYRYMPNPANSIQNTVSQTRPVHRPSPSKPKHEYPTSSHVPTPTRPVTKPLLPNQPSRMTVSVSSLVDQIRQQKRESPLDLSVKTVKNSADSSTTQEDVIDSVSLENKSLPNQQRLVSSGRQLHHQVSSLKVEFTPDFNQCRERNERNNNHGYPTPPHLPPMRRNGSYEALRPQAEAFPTESRYPLYPDRNKLSVSMGRIDYIPNQKVVEERYPDKRTHEGRNLIEERKRPRGPIVSNIPEKNYRPETWTADRHVDRLSASTREQHELMKQPVYSYTTYQHNETYPNEQKKINTNIYRDHHPHHVSPNSYKYPLTTDPLLRDSSSYHSHYHDRTPSSSNTRQVIQKHPNHRETHMQNYLDPRSTIPAEKSVKSLLRNSLESKSSKTIPSGIIIIDDGDDTVIEITDENETDSGPQNVPKPVQNSVHPTFNRQIQMPKAVDSISDFPKFDSADSNKSPENDVASRIRTKAELKVMPPAQDNSVKPNNIQEMSTENVKLLPKSQKQHIFNQIREDFRLEAVIKSEKPSDSIISEVKTEPINIDEIEKDAVTPLKTDDILKNVEPNGVDPLNDGITEDLDWANACDSFVEQLKSGCHKKKTRRKRFDTYENDNDVKVENPQKADSTESESVNAVLDTTPVTVIKQEPVDDDEKLIESANTSTEGQDVAVKVEPDTLVEVKTEALVSEERDKAPKSPDNDKNLLENERLSESPVNIIKKNTNEADVKKLVMKEESESTDDDEPLIKSKILKEKEQSERLKHQLLKDLSEKSAIVKLECCDADMNKNVRKSIELVFKDKEEKLFKSKLPRQTPRIKGKSSSFENKNEKQKEDTSSDSDEDNFSVASRLRVRKNVKTEENKIPKSPAKPSPSKKIDNSVISTSSTPARKPGFGDGSDFHPGWEKELYNYKRSLRMPTRLIAIPRGGSSGPFVKKSSASFTRGSTSLPDLDPAPLSPAPSSAPSAATDDLFARRPDKLTLDSDLDSNSSCSVPVKLNYDSEASTSTVFSSSNVKKKSSSIVDVLIKKCGRKEDSKKKSKDKDKKAPKVIPKTSNAAELLPTPSLGIFTNDGAFRKETVSAYRNAFLKNTDGLIGATEEFRPVVLKSKTRTESRILKQRATIKEVFGDERPASAPPISCREEEHLEIVNETVEIKKEELKPKLKPKKNVKGKIQRRSSSIKDGLRSTMSLKRNDANGRLMRLKKRNNLMKPLPSKRMKDVTGNKHKKEKDAIVDDKVVKEDQSQCPPEGIIKRRLKRLFVRRKFSSGFDYIRKKKKIIRREEPSINKVRRPAAKPSPESVHDIHKEIKSWFINKSIGETHLHRAARLGYVDCIAYCLEKMKADPSAKDNAGFTPLHVAAAKGYVRIARLLLLYGADVSAAAQGGIRPLHEACENCHLEVIRLLLSYGADPLLVTYAGQTPEELAEGPAALLLRLHIADVQGQSMEPWRFPPPIEIIDPEEWGCDSLASPPPSSPPPPDVSLELQCSEAPLPPFYSLRAVPGQPADGLWCLLQDINNLLQIKSKESLLKQIHCGTGSPKELVREIRTQEFLERAQCHQLLCAGEKVNIRASKVALVRVTDRLRQLLKVETVLVS